jgi:hypothetical protein
MALGNTEVQRDARRGIWNLSMSLGDYESGLLEASEFDMLVDHGSSATAEVVHSQLMIAVSRHCIGDQVESQRLIEELTGKEDDPVRPSTAYPVQTDGSVASMAVAARVLWLRGFPDRAIELAKRATAAGLAGAHELTICINLGLDLIPVTLWCGDSKLARELLDQLQYYSRRRNLRQWIAWADGYRSALDAASTPPILKTSPQLETAVTIGRADALSKLIAAKRHELRSWCQAEIIRRHIMLDKNISLEHRARGLEHGYAIAQGNGALSWQLRVASSLAHLDRQRGAEEGFRLLQMTLAQFTEGFETQDLREATELLRVGRSP